MCLDLGETVEPGDYDVDGVQDLRLLEGVHQLTHQRVHLSHKVYQMQTYVKTYKNPGIVLNTGTESLDFHLILFLD
jgi:hypothetical protein